MSNAVRYFIVVRAQMLDVQNGAVGSVNSIINSVAGMQSTVLANAGNLANATGSAVLSLSGGTGDVLGQLSQTVNRALANLANNPPNLPEQPVSFGLPAVSTPAPSQATVNIPGAEFNPSYAFSG